jgi:hypothetical protein
VYEEITQPRQIGLKAKYLTGRKSSYKGGEQAADKKHRRKLSDVQKRALPPQPKVILHVLANGRARFERSAA